MLESARRLADLEGRAARRDRHRRRRSGTRCAPSRRICRCGSASSTSSTTGAPTRPTARSSAPTGATSRRCARPSSGRSRRSTAAATGREYPAAALDEAWKLLLLNQFHDIIPGSSIHWANEDCLRDHARIAAITGDLIAAAQRAIAEQVDTTGMTRPFVVFNAASRDRRRADRDRDRQRCACSCRSTCRRAATPRSTSMRRRRAAPRGARHRSSARERVAARRRGTTTVSSRRCSTRSTTARCSRPVRAATSSNSTTTTRRSSTRGTSTSTTSTTASTSPRCRRSRLSRAVRSAASVRFVREFGVVEDHADDAARERIAAARVRHRGRLARAPQVLEGRVPGRRAREPRDLRDPVRPPRTPDAHEHVVGCRALRGVRAPLGRSERARLRRRAAERLQVRLRHPRQRDAALVAAIAGLARSRESDQGSASFLVRAVPARR